NWSGKTFTQSGTYYDTLQNIDGCDSVIQLNLNYLLEPNIQYLSNTCSTDSVVFSLFNTSYNYSYSLLNNIGDVLEGPKSNDTDDSIQFRTNPISVPTKYNIKVTSDTLLNFGTGNSLLFDGNNDRVNCGNDPSVQITGNQITL